MKRVCVYCGSSDGKKDAYKAAARELGRAMLEKGLGLVYGGAQIGIMGEIANTVMDGGGEVIGIMPKPLADREIYHTGLTRLEIVDSMHERKAMMAELSDGFIALPGGLGTIEEIFEVLTWAQLGFHRKPCALLNAIGYYDNLCAFLNHTVIEGFVNTASRAMLMTESDPRVLLERFENYQAPVVNKWIDKENT
ncbi:MAG TPA: TIGR00730 family Rossman fold protein [Desulfobacteraceae bacterium]|nr:TIGR00730 family Rossman fold protein [Desulfobacteraceae bacterium]